MSIGMVIFTKYKDCDILNAGKVQTGEQVFYRASLKNWVLNNSNY